MPRPAKGRYVRSDGYVILTDGKHGRYEHRVVMEQILGRSLKSYEIVHHIDGNRANNTRENLELTTLPEHNKGHLSKKVKTQCGYCGKSLFVNPSRLKLSKSGNVFCDLHCFGLYNAGGGLKGRPFTKEEDKAIKRLMNQGYNCSKIGQKLGRNRESIRVRARRLGVYHGRGC